MNRPFIVKYHVYYEEKKPSSCSLEMKILPLQNVYHGPEAIVTLISKTHLETRHFKMRYFEKPCFLFPELEKLGETKFMTKSHKSSVSKMSLIYPVRFRTWEKRLCQMPHF